MTVESYKSIIASALIAQGEQQVRLREALEETRQAVVAQQATERGAVEESTAIAAKVAQLEEELAKPRRTEHERSSELAMEIVALRERQNILGQQQSRLRERTSALTTVGRRLRLAIREGEAAIKALSDEGPVDEHDEAHTTTPWQVAQAQEDERARLAREIHDGPAQVLANAIFELEFCERLMDRDPVKLRTELLRLKEDLRLSLTDVRHFIFGLRPALLRELGLAAALRRYVEGFETRCGITVTLDWEDLPRLSTRQELAIFRIVQEALQNARKHSEASLVTLRLRNTADNLSIMIADNGVGFDTERVGQRGVEHFGLRGMQERALLIGAALEVTSKQGQGTEVSLVLSHHSSDYHQ